MHTAPKHHIDRLYELRSGLDPQSPTEAALIRRAIDLLDSGQARVAEIVDGEVVVHEWLKRAILLYFQIQPNAATEVGPFEIVDKVPLKTGLQQAQVRALPGSVARWARS